MQNKKANAATVANATNSANQTNAGAVDQTNAGAVDQTNAGAVKTVIIGGRVVELTKQLDNNPFEAKAREAKKGIIWTIGEALKNSPNGLTKVEALTILVNIFDDRPTKSLASTVNVQLPSRLSKDKGFIIKSVKQDDGVTRYYYKGVAKPTTDEQ